MLSNPRINVIMFSSIIMLIIIMVMYGQRRFNSEKHDERCNKASEIRILSNISTVDHFNSIITVSLEFIRIISAEQNMKFSDP